MPQLADPGGGRAAVILAGGVGTRLWPLSRSGTPKHLLPLLDGQTLLRATYERARLVADRVLVVTEATQLAACREQLPELADEDWIAEPGRRGTAACLALAAAGLPAGDVMTSLHADHLIPDPEAFARTVRAAMSAATRRQALATLGLTPREPATGFGYIEKGDRLGDEDGVAVFKAARFVEKPPVEEARMMVESGNYLWNTGIFAWPNGLFLAELANHAPAIAAGAERAAAARAAGRDDEYRQAYLGIEEMAVDHALMERTERLVTLEADFAWSDVGSWADLRDVLPHDPDGNAVSGDGLVLDGTGNVVFSTTGGRMVAVVGASDLVVVDTPDAVLVIPRDRVQDVKRLVAHLRAGGRDSLL
ncbi:MAG: mannose-1-phosphate guanylyltransferase [Candidatus Dormibacteria bacterium]